MKLTGAYYAGPHNAYLFEYADDIVFLVFHYASKGKHLPLTGKGERDVLFARFSLHETAGNNEPWGDVKIYDNPNLGATIYISPRNGKEAQYPLIPVREESLRT